jgi:ribosome biogenesis protein NSA2
LPKVRGIAEEEMFKAIKTGKHKNKSWKRMVNKATFVGEGFTRKPVKLEVSFDNLLKCCVQEGRS